MASKKQLRKAGRRIARGDAALSDYELLLWWRLAHIIPLEMAMKAVHGVLDVGGGSILVGRLKRFDTAYNAEGQQYQLFSDEGLNAETDTSSLLRLSGTYYQRANTREAPTGCLSSSRPSSFRLSYD